MVAPVSDVALDLFDTGGVNLFVGHRVTLLI